MSEVVEAARKGCQRFVMIIDVAGAFDTAYGVLRARAGVAWITV